MNERVALALEASGAALLVIAALIFNVALGFAAAGVALVVFGLAMERS